MNYENIVAPKSLAKAFSLLLKVLSAGETKYTKEDWQMLQVARFLVSKEKFIERDSDNRTLYYADLPAFYYIDDLNEVVYSIAKYVYDNDPGLIVDKTKVVDYGFPLSLDYAKKEEPTFDEAVIIINMIRNSIVHGNADIDYEKSVLHIDNTMPYENNPDVIKFHINCNIPMSMLAKLDIANIMKKNREKVKHIIYTAIARKNYIVMEDKVFLILDYNGFEMRLGLKTEEFMEIYYHFDEDYAQDYNIERQIEDFDVYKYNKLTLSKENIGTKFSAAPGAIDAAKTQKDEKDLSAIMALIDNDPSKSLDPRIIKRMLELADSSRLPKSVRMEALKAFRRIIEGAHYQNDTEKAIDSISSALGIGGEDESLNFVALYNYMTVLFAHYPLKEGNVMLTEFIDLSTLAVDENNTNDIDINNFYRDVEKIIRRHMKKYEANIEQYQYKMPCLVELLRCLTEILRKFKTRNNAYIRHIRNALDHSQIELSGDVVELRDYINNGDDVDKTFRSKISLDKLIQLSAAYTFIYNVPTYKVYQTYVSKSQNSLLSFSFIDVFRELVKGIDIKLLNDFMEFLNKLSVVGLEREFGLYGSVVDLVEELPYAISQLKKQKNKGPGSK